MKRFDTKQALEESVCAEIIERIEAAIDQYGDTHILLSGGSSPKGLYQKLAKADLPWEKVKIGLVDDRCVPVYDKHSNERMLLEIFSPKEDGVPEIFSLANQLDISNVEKVYAPFFDRIDVSLLGMGEDGHTASLFPGDRSSEENLVSSKKSIFNTISPVFPFRRITCSKALIASSETLILLLIGEKKLTVFEHAEEMNTPIYTFVKECPHLTTYYSPSE